MKRVRFKVVAVAAFFLALSGCVALDQPEADEAGQGPDRISEGEADVGEGQGLPEPEPFVPDRWIEMDVRNEDGSTYVLRVEVGEPVAASEQPTLDEFPSPSVCGVDAQRDLLIPARVLATSTTPDFTHEMRGVTALAAVGTSSPFDADIPPHWQAIYQERIAIAQTFSQQGPTCDRMGSDHLYQLSRVAFLDATEGQRWGHNIWIVINEFFTPAYPEGQGAILRGLGLLPVPRYPGQGHEVSNVSGTGIVQLRTLPFTEDSLFYEEE